MTIFILFLCVENNTSQDIDSFLICSVLRLVESSFILQFRILLIDFTLSVVKRDRFVVLFFCCVGKWSCVVSEGGK